MNELHVSKIYKNHIIEVYPGEWSESPRECGGNTWKLQLDGGWKYNWPNETTQERVVMSVPVNVLDHSGRTFTRSNLVHSLYMGMDSGVCGVAVLTVESMQEHGYKRLTKDRKEFLLSILDGELEMYTAYVNGMGMWDLVIKDAQGEVVDSMVGGYDDSCDLRFIFEEAHIIIDNLVKENSNE